MARNTEEKSIWAHLGSYTGAHLGSYIIEFLMPKRCVGCGARGTFCCSVCIETLMDITGQCLFCGTPAGGGVCRQCEKQKHIGAIYWIASYSRPAARRLIHAFKYQYAYKLSQTIAMLMLRARDVPQANDMIVVPIPLHTHKERARGFNQAKLLAEHIATVFELQMIAPGYFVRSKETPSQARTTSRKERRNQLRGAFNARAAADIKGKRILLIDDIATTGATLAEAARALHGAGASRIEALIFARG